MAKKKRQPDEERDLVGKLVGRHGDGDQTPDEKGQQQPSEKSKPKEEHPTP